MSNGTWLVATVGQAVIRSGDDGNHGTGLVSGKTWSLMPLPALCHKTLSNMNHLCRHGYWSLCQP